MKFHEQLNSYISKYNISGKDLAKELNISESKMSRYRTGKSLPPLDSEYISRLAQTILKYSNDTTLTYEEVYYDLSKSLPVDSSILNSKSIIQNFILLCDTLDINNRELANYLHYDPSFISRIKSGQRTPTNINDFINKVSDFIITKYNDSHSTHIIDDLLGNQYSSCESDSEKHSALVNWLVTHYIKPDNDAITHFLNNVNDFNLDNYIKAIHFDELKVPTAPFTLNTSKQYYGIKQMCDAELDFLKATVLSKSNEDVYMCSDMPMEDMSKIEDFPKKWMFGLAMVLKKGLHINIIHNLDRPFDELMLGLEAWIPLYMTGLVSPYYLKGKHNDIYCRINYASGCAALSGECISGHHNEGKYYVTKKPREVEYYKNKSRLLFDKAYPLMKVYKAENASEFYSFIENDSNIKGDRSYILSAPPLYTMHIDDLKSICKNNKLSNEDIENLLSFHKKQNDYYNTVTKNSHIKIQLYTFPEEDFKESPISMAISEAFLDTDIIYTYEEYMKHIEDTKEYIKKHDNIELELVQKEGFKNLQISIHNGKWAMVSKEMHPTIHFVIKHPLLRDALENLTITYNE